MRHRSLAALLLTAALTCSTVTLAGGAGSAGNPLISLNWLKNTWVPQTIGQAEEQIEEHMASLPLSAAATAGEERRVKRGDGITVETGGSVVLLAGSMTGSALGTIVDVTKGTELRSGAALQTNHRYIAAEQTAGRFTVTSDTAVVRMMGEYRVTLSDQTDYNALADALKAMGIFQGTDAPYGSGYSLENTPTRVEGLVLFLRLIGEEDAALRYSNSAQISFADVPSWALPYVSYAYQKGYTKGVGMDDSGRVRFDPEVTLTSDGYMTFLLRALQYREDVDFHWETAVEDAVALDILTEGERTQFASLPFLRAQVAYLSYYALFASVNGTEQTLLDRLTVTGAVDAKVAKAAVAAVTVERL